MAILDNPRSQRVKRVRALAGRSAREQYAQLLIEGPQAVGEIFRQPAERKALEAVRDFYFTDDAEDAHYPLIKAIYDSGAYYHRVSPRVMKQMAPAAQGVCAVVNSGVTFPLGQPLSTDQLRKTRLIACCIHIEDPGNAGSIIRSAHAAGADAVVLGPGSVDPTSPKVIRFSAGSALHIPVWRLDGPEESEAMLTRFINEVRSAGHQIFAADGNADLDMAQLWSTGLETDGISLRRPTTWLFGNEAAGFTRAQREMADHTLSLPMWGSAESLNVAVAAGLCLYSSAFAQARTD